jgi:spore maturation protein SpmA
VVLAAFLRGAVAGVVHGEKMKTSAEVREREEETVVVSGVGVVGLWLG